MSRFTPSRRNQIMVWTGAALAWGTAFVAGKVEPVRAAERTGDATSEQSVSSQPAMPQAPVSGLTIIRYTPSEKPDPEVRYVYVQVPSATSSTPAANGGTSSPSNTASAPPPPAQSTPAPSPPSSGS